ncbi:hypothetical protein TIFTF001_016526 [Ficus carica]|uniref:Uncharacterized protein n=1 Tax=Ficus carica TaxID=3494 RepID=A0AA88A396_FICCA|nr:hypothetical protein TIFTF001_016526 [Ficus carica]
MLKSTSEKGSDSSFDSRKPNSQPMPMILRSAFASPSRKRKREREKEKLSSKALEVFER